MQSDALLELLHAHRSVRTYAERALDEALLERCVRAAQACSTSHHVQAYSLLRVRHAPTRSELAALCGGQAHVERAPAFWAVCVDQRRLELAARLHGRAFVQNFESFLAGAIDAALFAQALALAFEAHGLGLCFIGGLRNEVGRVAALLELPRGVLPLFGLCAGHPAEQPPARPRLPLAAILHEERCASEDELHAQLRLYDEQMRAYWGALGKPGHDWTGGMARLHARPARDALSEHYTALGAVLGRAAPAQTPHAPAGGACAGDAGAAGAG
jgi:FMN reductase (NADPH)